MSNLKLFYSLFRLKASNENLLKFYYRFFYKIVGPHANEEKEILSNRIALRERLKLEHQKFIEENIPANFFFSQFISLLRLEKNIKKKFRKLDWSCCEEMEKKNIKIYNRTIYTKNPSVLLNKMLLNQKYQIEESLFKKSLADIQPAPFGIRKKDSVQLEKIPI